MAGLIVLLIIGGIIVSIFGLVFWYEKKRREEWQSVAKGLGFTYLQNDNSIQQTHNCFKIFNQGHGRQATNVIRGGKDGIAFVIADYRYTTGGRKNSSTHYQTICIVENTNFNIPHFFLRREIKIFDFLGKMFGGQDINFDEDTNFSNAFVLQGESEGMVRKLFTKEIRRAFMEFEGSNLQVEARGNMILIHEGTSIKPMEVKNLMAKAFKIMNIFL
ncbi:hypothetical protein ACFL35_20705 [Candidatus Riflebacteria bacterium]